VATEFEDPPKFRVVTAAADEADPCNSYDVDLTGEVEVQDTGDWKQFDDVTT